MTATYFYGLWCAIFLAAPLVAAEEPSSTVVEQERAAIEATRRIETERLDARTRDCSQKFATTRCLDQVRGERLSMEAQLRQREEVLNAAQRQQRGQEQLVRSQEKAQMHAEKLASIPATPEKRAFFPKPPAAPGGEPSLRATSSTKLLLTPEERSANVRDYERKHAQAQAKRAEVAKRIKEKGDKKAPLPTLPK